jgi:hypothetical protein
VHLHPWGLASKSVNAVMKNMESITKELKHENRTVDIFIIDCEGCEWETVHGYFSALPHSQIQVELHLGTQDGKAARFLEFVQSKGYVAFHKESNTLGCSGACIEYSFLHLNTGYFSQ